MYSGNISRILEIICVCVEIFIALLEIKTNKSCYLILI